MKPNEYEKVTNRKIYSLNQLQCIKKNRELYKLKTGGLEKGLIDIFYYLIKKNLYNV